jgi:hypothetical protein
MAGRFHQGRIQLFMLLAMRIGFGRQDAHRPLAVGAIVDVLALDRVFPAVEIDLILAHGNTGNRQQILGDRNGNRRIAWQTPRTGNDLADGLFCHGLLSFWRASRSRIAGENPPHHIA